MNQDAAPDFSVANLVAVLAKHGIDASVSGPPRTASRMCSLLAVEPHGLYYATREARLPESIVDSVIVCDAGNEPGDDRNTRIVTNNPQLAFYLLQRHFFGRSPRRGIHPTAIVADEASIDPSAYIGPYCVIGRARVGGRRAELLRRVLHLHLQERVVVQHLLDLLPEFQGGQLQQADGLLQLRREGQVLREPELQGGLHTASAPYMRKCSPR